MSIRERSITPVGLLSPGPQIGSISPEREGKDANVFFLDAGTTRLKGGVATLHSGELSIPSGCHDGSNFIARHIKRFDKIGTDSRGQEFRYVDGDSVMKTFDSLYKKTTSGIESIDAFISVGFTNNLVVRRENNGKTKTIIFKDDPSPAIPLEDLDSSELAFLNYVSDGMVVEKGVKRASSLAKLLWIKHDGGVMKTLFGDDVSFEDLQFGTVQSLLIERMTGENIVPRDDVIALAGGYNRSIHDIRNLLRSIGVGDHQITLSPSRDIFIRGMRVSSKQDISANFGAIRQALNNREFRDQPFPENVEKAIFLETDSVLKDGRLLPLGLTPVEGAKERDGLEYRSQRMGIGNVINNIWKDVVSNQFGEDDERAFFRWLDKAIENGLENKGGRFMFFPNRGHEGELVKIHGDNFETVDLQSPHDVFSDEDAQEIAQAMLLHTVFEARYKAERMVAARGDLLADVPIFFYGGFPPNTEVGKKYIAQAFPHERVYHLMMPNAAKPGVLTTLYDWRWISDDMLKNHEIKYEVIPKQTDFDREKEYQEWLYLRKDQFKTQYRG